MADKHIDSLSGLVIVTGASSGIGLQLAKRAARDGVSLILVADRDLAEAEQEVRRAGAKSIERVRCDLGTQGGVQQVVAQVGDRPVAALIANAGQGEGGLFLDQEWREVSEIIDTNVIGTAHLVHEIGRRMRAANHGRILITGSIAGHMPGPFNLVYNSTKAFLDFFSVGLANELKDTEVTVTCLLPGATDTAFFERADMVNTRVGQQKKADPAKVAEDGYEAMLEGDTQIVSGFMNKLQYLFADLLPDNLVAQMHRRLAEPRGRKAA
jgi:short-subunit dehydrogenase